MGKVKEHAKRAFILLAVAGILFSSVAITVVYFMQNNNASTGDDLQRQLQEQLEQQQQEEAVQKEPLTGYEATPFDKAAVTELGVEVLKEGDGPAATAESTVNANYFGWTSDGKIFDSTNRDGTTEPIAFPLSGVIEGWTKGLTGIKQGSVVKLMIPGEMAYGNEDTGTGRPFGPLAFIVELKEVK